MEQSLKVIFGGSSLHRPLGTSSACECLGMVRRICRYASHLHLIRPLDICVRVPNQKCLPTPPFTTEEQQQLRDFLLSSPTTRKVWILLGMQMRLRIGEICGLQWKDFDLADGVLYMKRTVTRISCGNGHTKIVVQAPKTNSSRREIPIPKKLTSILRQLKGKLSSDTWFLSGCTDKPVEPRCYRKSIQCYLRQAKVRVIRPHDLRHTFATSCLQAGCDIKTLSELLGHTHADTTLHRYVHSDFTRKRREMNRIFSESLGIERSQRQHKINSTS